MLRHLSIRDFVIVDALELEFDAGFTVLTGETGAGKSILIDALAARARRRAATPASCATGAARADITAEFDDARRASHAGSTSTARRGRADTAACCAA